MLCAENIHKSFKGNSGVLKGVDLLVDKGKAVCIAGKNASGKTTLLNIISQNIKADSGKVTLGGKISMVSQQPALLSELSEKDNLKLFYAAQNISKPPFSDSSAEMRLGLFEFGGKKVKTLSGGMKKRLSIACALCGKPDILLLDEPFAALDAAACQNVCELLLYLKANGTTIVFTSHQPQYISAVADVLFILHDGKLSKYDNFENLTPQQLSQRIISLIYSD